MYSFYLGHPTTSQLSVAYMYHLCNPCLHMENIQSWWFDFLASQRNHEYKGSLGLHHLRGVPSMWPTSTCSDLEVFLSLWLPMEKGEGYSLEKMRWQRHHTKTFEFGNFDSNYFPFQIGNYPFAPVGYCRSHALYNNLHLSLCKHVKSYNST